MQDKGLKDRRQTSVKREHIMFVCLTTFEPRRMWNKDYLYLPDDGVQTQHCPNTQEPNCTSAHVTLAGLLETQLETRTFISLCVNSWRETLPHPNGR